MRTTHLPIAEPCHEDWDAMDRVERGRFCQSCVKQVFDLSSMNEGQVRGLLREKDGSRICVRYEHDDDGRIRFRDAPAPTCGSTPRRAAWVGAAVMAATMAACTPHERVEVRSTAADPVETSSVAPVEIIPHADPIRGTTKGEIVAIEPPPDVQPVSVLKGDTIAAPREPEPVVHERMGDIAAEPVREVKGNMAAWPEPVHGEPAGPDEPCDGAPAGG